MNTEKLFNVVGAVVIAHAFGLLIVGIVGAPLIIAIALFWLGCLGLGTMIGIAVYENSLRT